MSNAVDDAVLALLDAVPLLNWYDGEVTDSDGNEKTISAPLPYVVLYTSMGDPDGHSLAGAAGFTVQSFQINYVGLDRRQAKWASQKSRAALCDVRLVSVSRQPIIRLSEDDNLSIRRDDVWTRPDGGSLQFGVDRYSLAY